MINYLVVGAVLFAPMALPSNVAAQSDMALTVQNPESSGNSESRQELLDQLQDMENIVRSDAFSEAIARPLAQLEVEHHRVLGAQLVECQIGAIATAINGNPAPGSNSISSHPSAENATVDAACEKRSDRRKIRRQRERNQLLYDALASIGGYYNNGTDQEKTVLMVGGRNLLNSPLGTLVTQAIGAFANQIEQESVQTDTDNHSTAVIAAALSLFDKRDFLDVIQEIEAEDNTHQSHNAATGIRVLLSVSARNR